jgi:hypothetical protein
MRRRFYYDKNSGYARVMLNKKGITAWGSAKLHPDDADYGNEFTGLGIAEMRAEKQLLEKRARIKKQKYKRYQALAEYYEQLYKEDLHRASEVDAGIVEFIEAKAELHAMLRNPQRKVEWKTLPENFFDGVELDAKSIGALEQGERGN